MSKANIYDVVNNMCNLLIEDYGKIEEEVIEMLIDSGANVNCLKEIGFTDKQINDYIFYRSTMTDVPEEDVYNELYTK